MTSDTPYLLDELENTELLEIDGLYSWQFSLDESVLDQADAAAEAELPFASEAILLRIDVLDGRDQRKWQFSYNDVLEAIFQPETRSWLLCAGEHQHVLKCQADVAASADNQE